MIFIRKMWRKILNRLLFCREEIIKSDTNSTNLKEQFVKFVSYF